MIITIDGPAGTGKTSVAKKLAERLHFFYFDTGAMYRCIALLVDEQKISLSDDVALDRLLEDFTFSPRFIEGKVHYFIRDRDVTAAIRTHNINQIVSMVSAVPIVRQALWKMQRAFAEKGNAVFEGRDMGSIVFPQAEVKFFLTARSSIRAERRWKEMHSNAKKGSMDKSCQEVLEEIEKRDRWDSTRSLAPLVCPEDAHVIDTSDLSIDEVVAIIEKIVVKA